MIHKNEGGLALFKALHSLALELEVRAEEVGDRHEAHQGAEEHIGLYGVLMLLVLGADLFLCEEEVGVRFVFNLNFHISSV